MTNFLARRQLGRRAQDCTAKEGHTMNNPAFWIELLIVVLRIFSAGLSA